MAAHDTGSEGRRAGFDRTGRVHRRGSVFLVLFIAFVLIGASASLVMLGQERAQPAILFFLAALATIGIFSLFGVAAGILRTGGDEGRPLLKSVLDSAGNGVLVTDSSGRVVYANAAYLDLIGAADDKDVRPIERVFIGDPDVSESIYRLLKAAREGRRLREEVRVPGAKSGAAREPARWLQLLVRPLDDKSDLTVWSITDVTRDRERHENIFQELQHAVDYLDHAPAGFFSVDAQGEVVYLNATLAGWLDHDLAQVGSGGLKLTDIVAGEGAVLLTTLNATAGEVKTEVIDLDLKTRTGKPVPVRLFHKVAFGADGVPGISRTLVLNRGREEGAAGDPQRAAEVRFMRFFHNTPMAIATVDKTGRIARDNPRFARAFEDALKDGERSILRVVAERDRGALEAAIRKAAEGQSDIVPVEASLVGGGERWATFFVSAVDEEDRDSEAAIIYALETTAQRTLENRINQQQKMESVGQLAGGIAHDFNNVLSAIMMATDFLLNAHKPTDPSFSDIMQIKQNANRAAALVRQLLAFSRKQTLRPQVLDLNETLNDLTMLLKRLIGEKVSLVPALSRDLWPVKADLSQFEQVIVNLAVNARDAMPDGGKLTVHTANVPASEAHGYAYKGMPDADYVLIEVGDTGTGIPKDIIDKIFEPFFSTKEVGKGTGLGLSTVYGIVKQTGGYVYVESKAGETTFRIFLPRHMPGAEEGIPKVTDAPAIAGAVSQVDKAVRAVSTDLTGQGRILLVEDEEGLRALNARGLSSRGYTVLEASNGVEAIEVLEREGAVDLVVSDVVMPEMDGPTLLKELRQRDPKIRVIFVSGYAEEAFQKNLPQGEQYAFLAKPFTLKQLVAAVKETMTA
ncbi:MAG: response regulator [Pseudolabrys sp.]|nr:response regulator [Pseudolabrys sp.]